MNRQLAGTIKMSRISFLQDMLTSLFDRSVSNEQRLDDRDVDELCSALLSSRGELSGSRIASAILDRFDTADASEQHAWFRYLLTDLDIDAVVAVEAARAYAEDPSAEHWRQLAAATESSRLELLRRINHVPNATGRLVAMREQLLPLLQTEQELARVDNDFEQLFSSWFNRGFLVLRQIDWDTPASVLEKLIEYEAVHAINDWSDLRRRLQPADRRCFAFFHPAMPDDPLIFVEVALTQSLPESIQSILAADRQTLAAVDADTAVFYSISNCQPGLRGVSFGNFLIKQVARELAGELGNLKTFRTLSPVPSFVSWLQERITVGEPDGFDELAEQALAVVTDGVESASSEQLSATSALMAHYLVKVRRDNSEPRDPVARFHLGNGASLSSIVGAADHSPKGLSQSAGVMVSYLYDLDAIEVNHEAYAQERTVTHAKEVENLLKSLPDSGDRKQIVNG
ncbi:MAG: malonyl-CoA decarboxylase [Granulosicoccus sp.]|nr:malonyl-CoA decarboxylase [Granulosicoccus sp.]